MHWSWTSHPAKRRPQDVFLLAGVVMLSAWAVLVTLESPLLAGLASLILLVSVAPFWLPTHYRLDDDGVEARRLWTTKRRSWADLRRAQIGAGAALVSPFSRPTWMDRHRGVMLYFDGLDARDAVVAALRERLPVNVDAAATLEQELTDDDRAFLDELADGLTKRRLAPAAVFLLESVKPLGWLGSQLLLLFRPMVAIVFRDPVRWDRVQRLLEHREAVELLLRRLEARY